ncbi:anthranilate synthase component I [Parvularcula bermudensis HTCC2503]|uniref:Anthranilate synthase component 1 n=1 Tax=Parvularcula bermudensis (strain ATCC BAA-594 / HTCC2503 / KCTC 12087) TaxID=314260 RepID=E0TGS5_PARBH|nr:anthranilate synthase component I [Parvularcula bermudensis]ADM10684.1 anthranilate synthase component I [Parvularcula bermudensis HTCC2503]
MTTDGYLTPAPAFEAFARIYERGEAQLVWRRVVGDLDTPVSAYLKLAGHRKNAFLLESVEGGDTLGRYSTIGLKPDLIWRAHGDKPEINRTPHIDPNAFHPDEGGTIASLTRVLDDSRIAIDPDIQAQLPPMAAGMFGYFGYDFVRLAEHLPHRPPSPYTVPDGLFVRPTILAIFDNVTRDVTVITQVRADPQISAKAAYGRAAERLADAIADLNRPVPAEVPGPTAPVEFEAHIPPEAYREMVLKAKDYIAAGDVFQVVLAQRFSTPYDGDPFSVYRTLRRINPSPFLFYLNFEGLTLLGASPEILVRVRQGQVTIRPIAGTRPRGATPEEDLALEAELLADPKERAEHLMLLDLGRNDVGRSSEFGTVTPTETFFIERYSHVMHIVSNVTGTLRPDLRPLDALAHGFPAGTLTGAPKVRAMEIIDELEPEGRGPYGGCIGYFGADGGFDTCIGLRMAIHTGGRLHVTAGAGIVADSRPESEQAECEVKARAILTATKMAADRKGRN